MKQGILITMEVGNTILLKIKPEAITKQSLEFKTGDNQDSCK